MPRTARVKALTRDACVTLLVMTTAACVRGEPVHLSAAGIADGRLRYLLGDQCEGVIRITARLMNDRGDQLRTLDAWVVESRDHKGADISELAVGMTPEGFTETDRLAQSISVADVVLVDIEGVDSSTRGSVDVSALERGATEHPGEWYVDGEGWLTEQEFEDLIDPADYVYPGCPP